MQNCFISIIILFSSCNLIFAQDEQIIPTQTIRGTVLNYNSKLPIPGVTVKIIDSKFGANTANDGSFRIGDVPTGRYIIGFSAVGYETSQQNILINSGKESILTIELNEQDIKDQNTSLSALNKSALVSATKIILDDIQRFAGVRQDVARMVQNCAGVFGANDQRNDLIIRGGSPTELLWRIDGLDIPNPNHFATQGATCGSVSALNHNLLGKSNFFTGAYPANYGDKMSGVFDINTKKGNDEKYEFIGELGFTGFELGAQGPISVEKSSFIANYRNSFFDLLNNSRVDFGFYGIPK